MDNNKIDMKLVNKLVDEVLPEYGTKNIFKAVREIAYAIAYSQGERTQENYEQLNQLQSQFRNIADLFMQSVEGREFDDGYLKDYLPSHHRRRIINDLRKKIEELEDSMQ